MDKITENEMKEILSNDIFCSEEEIFEFLLELYKTNKKDYFVSSDIFKKVYKDFFKSNNAKSYDLLKFMQLNNYIEFKQHGDRSLLSNWNNDDLINANITKFFKNEILIRLKYLENKMQVYLLEKAEKLSEENNKLFEKVNNYTKNIITTMGLFVSIVALISTNVSVVANEISNINIISMNLSILLVITTIFFFINMIFVDKKQQESNINIYIFIIDILVVLLLLLSCSKIQ